MFVCGSHTNTSHKNKYNFKMLRDSLNVSARVDRSSIYFCEKYVLTLKNSTDGEITHKNKWKP